MAVLKYKDPVTGEWVAASGPPGEKPVKGKDYWTGEDKAEIVADVLAALPTYNGEVEDA